MDRADLTRNPVGEGHHDVVAFDRFDQWARADAVIGKNGRVDPFGDVRGGGFGGKAAANWPSWLEPLASSGRSRKASPSAIVGPGPGAAFGAPPIGIPAMPGLPIIIFICALARRIPANVTTVARMKRRRSLRQVPLTVGVRSIDPN